MRDTAMIFDDRKRIARNNFSYNIYIGKHCAQSGRECSDWPVPLGKISLADKGANDAVSYRVHEGFEKGEVYTIGEIQAISISGDRLATASPINCAETPRRLSAACVDSAASGVRATRSPPEVCGS